MKTLVSKTDYILYRECPKNVWIKWHIPEEYKKFEPSDFEKSLGVMGNEVEELARKIFPGGYLIERRSDGARELTEKLIAEHTPVIFQAVFSTEKYFAATDILKWNVEANMYDIYEVKMSSVSEEDYDEDEEGKPKKVNKKRELQYEYDLAFQTNVAKLCGLNFNRKYLLRLNKEYVRGDTLNINKLFEETDKTEILSEAFLSVALVEMENVHVYLSSSAMPAAHCDCYYNKGRSSHCTTFSISNPGVPEYGVHDLNRIGNSKKLLKELLDDGILKMEDVPEHMGQPPKKKLKPGEKESKPRKLNQVSVHRTKEPIIDYDAIKKELDSLMFPLYFLDYETFPTAVPIFSGYHPYQHIVFQYSLHILTEDLKLTHEECLILDGDPAERLVSSLRKHIGNTGSVVSWYKKFENSRNRDMMKLVPSQADFLQGVIDRTYDLMDIVENQYYVHHGFRGSSSIKKVQPIIAPELAYEKLFVKSGTDAIEAYRQILKGEVTGEALEEKRRHMLEYCKYDTKVMYVIWNFFKDLVK